MSARHHRAQSDLVVFVEFPPAIEHIAARFPDVTVIDISSGVPEGSRAEVLFGGLSPHSSEAMASGVRWVQSVGTGIDALSPQIRAAPILTSARGASAVAISEYVIASMGAFARQFPKNWLEAPPEHWNYQPASVLAGSTLSLFGFGGIAQRIARIAVAMEIEVVAMRRRPEPSPFDGVTMVGTLSELVSVADHLVIAAPATQLTHHVIDDDAFAMMRPGVHLVNIARAALLDQDALARALDNGIVGRASLDVTDPEPLPAGHWLYSHPKVFLTPHASWCGPAPLSGAIEIFLDNLGRYLANEELIGLVGDQDY